VSVGSAKYSPEQKQAVVDAVLNGVEGQPGRGRCPAKPPIMGAPMTAPEAVAAAAEGRLPGMPAFDIHVSTVRDEVQRAKRERAGAAPRRSDRTPVPDLAADVVRRALRIAEATIERAERRPAKSPVTPREATDLLKLAEHADRVAKQHSTAPASPGRGERAGDVGDQAQREPARSRDFVDQLLTGDAETAGPSGTRGGEDDAPTERDDTLEPTTSTSAQHDATAESRHAGAPVSVHEKTSALAPSAAGLAAARAVLEAGAVGV
jgi:hypothetical protein